MATVTRESLGTLHDKITIRLEKTDYLPTFDKSIKEYAKKAAIPGFRKGMVPVGLVRKMYGQSVFTDEVVKIAGRELEDFLKNEKLSIFAQPMVLPGQDMAFDMSNPGDYSFFFEIGIKPEFEVGPIKNKATVTKYKIAVSDKLLNDEIDRIRKQQGNEVEAANVADAAHVVHLSYQLLDDNGAVAEGYEKSTQVSEVEKFPAKYQELLKGKKTGDAFTFVPSEVCTAEELGNFLRLAVKHEDAGNNKFLVTIDKVANLVPLEMGAELFEKVYPGQGVNDEATFREKIKEELGREFGRLATERLQNEIFELLVHQTEIELPVNFLKRYLREGGEKAKSEEQVEKEFSGFEHSLRWQLISDRLMSDYGISVTRDEVLDDIMGQVLSYFGVKNLEDAPWLDSYRQRISKDQKQMEEAYNKLIVGKLFQKLETVFNLDEKEIGEEEFFKLGDAHAAHHHHH